MKKRLLSVILALSAFALAAQVVDCASESAFAVIGRESDGDLSALAVSLEKQITAREGVKCRAVTTLSLPANDVAATNLLWQYGRGIREKDEESKAIKRIGALVTPNAHALVEKFFAYDFRTPDDARESALGGARRLDALKFPIDGKITDDTLDFICGFRIDAEHPVCAFESGEPSMTVAEAIAAMEAGDWIDAEMAKTRKAIATWQGKDEVVLVAFECDLHVYAPPRGRWPNRETLISRDNFRHVKRFAKVVNEFGVDLAADLGDLGFDYSGRHWKPACKGERVARLALQCAGYDLIKVPFMAIPGNHDGHWDSPDGFGKFMNPEGCERIRGFVLGPTRSYGYYDLSKKHTRIFLLNTSESGNGGGWVISEAQVAFMQKAVAETPDGWATLFFSHDCLHRMAGSKTWKERPRCKRSKTYCEMRALLEAIANGGRLKLGGIFCGDSHFGRLHEENGVRYFICDWARPANGPKKMLVHIAAMKPATGEAKLFDVGHR